MNHDFPLATYYAIILASLVALAVSHALHIEGESAMPLFVGAIAVGLLLGEIFERIQGKSPEPR